MKICEWHVFNLFTNGCLMPFSFSTLLLLKKSNILNSWKNFPYISIFFIYSTYRLYEQHIAKLALPHVWSLFSLWSINLSYSCNFKVSCRHYCTSSWILWLDFNISWSSFSIKFTTIKCSNCGYLNQWVLSNAYNCVTQIFKIQSSVINNLFAFFLAPWHLFFYFYKKGKSKDYS